MGKADKLELDGIVTEVNRGSFKVAVQMGAETRTVLAYPSGKIRKFAITIVVGDTVKVEFSPYDLTKGRIIHRKKI